MANLIRATNLWGYEELLRERGHDPLPLLARHHIPPAEQRDDQTFLIYKDVAALFDETAQALDFPELGLHLAEYQGIDILGPISVIARSAPTMGDAASGIARYLHLHCPALNIRYMPQAPARPGVIRLDFRIEDGNSPYQLQAYELSLANMRHVMKLLCGDDIAPISVHFMHQRCGERQIYEDVFNCAAHFNQTWCGFDIPVEAFAVPLTSADHQTWRLAEQYLSSQQAPNPVSLTENVIRLIRTLLPMQQYSSDVVAAQLAMHKRTLQRRLEKEGTTYEALLTAERQRLAQLYLRDLNMQFSQIAGLLGYSEQSAFNRACRSWFKMTPKECRAKLQETQ